MNICNACRYCEGLCATFEAMTLKRAFLNADLDYLANLCHNCTSCFQGCQYSPPHEFDLNVPRALASLRLDTYKKYAWPGFMARLFERNGLVVSMATALSLAVVIVALFAWHKPSVLFARHTGPGAFYEIVSHEAMVVVAAIAFCYSVLALAMGARRFWRSPGALSSRKLTISVFRAAARDAATLKYLGGGHGEGCNTTDEHFSNARRYFHQFTMFGFLLCFAATCVAALYDYVLGISAPYPLLSLPVILGTIGGAGLLVGPAGLFSVKVRSDSRPMNIMQLGMDYAFLALLFLISLSGLLLLIVRDTSLMGVTLVVHLGFVLGLFVTLPYSKFVHGIYRSAALLRFEAERIVANGHRTDNG
jgi:citrate/tricarballylate utilization protein